MRLRHQLAAYSPLTAPAVAGAVAAGVRLHDGGRRALERLVCSEYEADYALLCGSGTQALQVAIVLATGSASRAAVALPAFSCFDVASAAVGAGVGVLLYDLDPETLAPDMASLERALIDGARAVVAAPLYGMPFDVAAVAELASRFGAALIEDAAQGHGASWRGRKLGTLADISTLSFGRGKGWTGGAGGAVLYRGKFAVSARENPLVARGVMAELTASAALVAQWVLGRPSLYGVPRAIPSLELGTTVYHPPSAPAAATRVAASAAVATHAHAVREAEIRRTNAARILNLLEGSRALRSIRRLTDGVPGYLRLPVRTVAPSQRVLSSAAREIGIERSYPTTLAELAVIAERLAGSERRWPGARELAEHLVTLPTHSRLTDQDFAFMQAVLGSTDAGGGER